MNFISAIKYYIFSIPTIIFGVNFYAIPLLCFKNFILLKTRHGTNYFVKNLIEIWTIKEVVLDKQYEVHREVKKNDIVVDIGAAIGEFTIYAGKKANLVYAFEVNKNRTFRLKSNIQENKLNNIIVVNEKVTSLNKVFNDLNIEKCNFLKIDCEGCEYEIFESISLTVLNKIEYIAMEVHFFNSEMQNKYKDLIKLLSKHFNIVETQNPVHSNLAFLYAVKKLPLD